LEVIFFIIPVLIAGPAALTALIGGIIVSWKGIAGIAETNRSYRRFIQSHQISDKEMLKLVNLSRLSASGANLQPLKYILSNTEEKNQKIFPTLSWAGYLKEWPGPVEGEKPSAYIIMLGDSALTNSFQYDAGIACQSILLGAAERGLGGCLIGSIKKDSLRKALSIPEGYEILLVIALGKPGEKVVIEDITPEGDIKYWRDENDIHHVPKRGLGELILDL
jgi:nitroreductase